MGRTARGAAAAVFLRSMTSGSHMVVLGAGIVGLVIGGLIVAVLHLFKKKH